MASLALIVTLIFIIVLASGPLSLTAGYFNLRIISQIIGIVAIIFGAHWITFAPFPICLIGVFSIWAGIKSFFKNNQ